MSICKCLTAKGVQCSRTIDANPQANHKYCWQHQNCKKSISTTSTSSSSTSATSASALSSERPVVLKKIIPVPPIPIRREPNVLVPIKKESPKASPKKESPKASPK